MSVTVSYNSYSFVPAPIFNWSTELIRDSRGSGIALRNNLVFNGDILKSSGSDSNISDIFSERDSIVNALKTDNAELQILENGSGLLSGVYPKITDFTMDEGVWFDRSSYSFTATYEEPINSNNISDFQESWTYEEDENRRTVTINHSVSAVGIDTSGNSNALSNAKTFVLTRVGSSNQPPSHPAFVQASGSTSAYEGVRTESANVTDGSFSISEVFNLSSGAYIHTQNSSMDISDGVTTVSLQGQITGLGRKDEAYSNALSGWVSGVRQNLPANASGVYSELGGSATLYTSNATNQSVSKNEFNGTISYNYSYTDDEEENLPSGIESFSITFSDSQPTILYSSSTIFGRTLGNVVQNIGTPTEGSITIAGSAKAEAGYLFTDLVDYCETRINSIRPNSADYVTLRLTTQNVTKNEEANEVQFSLQWNYTKSLSVAKIDGPVDLS